MTKIAKKKISEQDTSDREIVLTRVLDAPRELVWKAWTESEHLARWWAPKGCSTPFCTVDLRPGGRFHYCMRMPDGSEVWGIGVYREVVEPERIVYTDSFSDEKGNPVPPSCYGMSESHPAETVVTVTFDEHQGNTTVTLHHSIPESVEEREGTEQGWKEMLERLAENLQGGKMSAQKTKPAFELVLERVIDASRARVFEAWTKPEQMTQWFAPKPFTLTIDKMDFRPGGRFSMAMRGPNGDDFPFTGTYREIVPPAKLSWTGEFSSGPADQISTVVTFEEQGQKTKVHVRQTFHVMTPEIEDASKGAKQGWTMTLDQLAGFCSRQAGPNDRIVKRVEIKAPGPSTSMKP